MKNITPNTLLQRLLLFGLTFFLLGPLKAQDPDPELFDTWYLVSVSVSDAQDPIFVVDIFPPVQPYVTINSDLSYEGFGSCNSFNGLFEYFDPEYLSVLNYSSSTNECESQAQTQIEEWFFFYMMHGAPYDIDPDGDGLKLTMTTPIYGVMTAQNYPLSIQEELENSFKVFPNPASDRLMIESLSTPIDRVELYDMRGIRLLLVTDYTAELDLTAWPSGMYLLKIFSEEKSTIKRIIKE